MVSAANKLLRLAVRVAYGAADLLVPKDDTLAVFMQREAEYTGNCRVTFDRVRADEDPELQAVWIGRNSGVMHEIQAVWGADAVVSSRSLHGIWLSLRARMFVSSHGLEDYGWYTYFSPRTYWIELWHGMPLKTLGVMAKSRSHATRSRYLGHNRRCSLMISSSKMDRLCMAANVGVRGDHIVVTGLPRNDLLVNEAASTPSDSFAEEWRRILESQLILYAPTFRDTGSSNLFPFEHQDLNAISEALEQADAYLMIRLHVREKYRLENQIASLAGHDRILVPGPNEFPDVQALLPFTDVLVTDYSSIYLDYLLLDRPIVFMPYDLEFYERDRGFSYEYEDMAPGPCVYTQDQFLNAFGVALTGRDGWEERRAFIRRLFHKFDDGQNTDRVLTCMKKLVRDGRQSLEAFM